MIFQNWTESKSHDLAMHLHDLGFSIMPVRNKRPAVKWKELQRYRLDPENFSYWFTLCECDVAIITGRLSGIIAIDCDTEEAASLIEDCHDSSPVQQRTKKGRHYIYRWPGIKTPNRFRIDKEPIDVRGDGGYIVAYDDASKWTKKDIMSAPRYRTPNVEDPYRECCWEQTC